MIERTTRMNSLLDFYQTLLTAKQRTYMGLYYFEDYSLGEISELHNVSRQAIYDNIRRTENTLENYEEKLQLNEKFTKRKKLLEELENSYKDKSTLIIENFFQKIKELD